MVPKTLSGANNSLRSDDVRPVFSRIASDLAQKSSSAGSDLKLEVISKSMSPLIRPGDRVIVQKAKPESLQIGDVVVVWRKEEFITHRLVGSSTSEWYTKGDHCRYLDPPVSADSIMGKVVSIEREDMIIDLQTPTWTVVNRGLGHVHWWQGRIFQVLRALRSRLNLKQ